jgi:hypothetical protein
VVLAWTPAPELPVVAIDQPAERKLLAALAASPWIRVLFSTSSFGRRIGAPAGAVGLADADVVGDGVAAAEVTGGGVTAETDGGTDVAGNDDAGATDSGATEAGSEEAGDDAASGDVAAAVGAAELGCTTAGVGLPEEALVDVVRSCRT